MLGHRLTIDADVVPNHKAIEVENADNRLLNNIPLILFHNSLANCGKDILDIKPFFVLNGGGNIGNLYTVILLQELKKRFIEQRILATTHHIVALICRFTLQSYRVKDNRGKMWVALSWLKPL